jgi:hypothetical protein
MPFIYESLDHEGKETLKAETPSFSFGIGASNYSVFQNPVVGIIFFGDFLFPKAYVLDRKGEETSYKPEGTVLSVQFGLGYRLINNERFKVPLTFGLHFFSMSGTSKISPAVTSGLTKFGFGLGASAGGEFHINPSVYVFGRLQCVFDVIMFTEWIKYTGVSVGGKMAYFIEADEYAALFSHIELLPVLGIGIKIDGFFSNQ